jgi:hypothetical protein
VRRQKLSPEFGDRGLAGVGIGLQRAVDRVRHSDRQPGPRVGQPPQAWTGAHVIDGRRASRFRRPAQQAVGQRPERPQ